MPRPDFALFVIALAAASLIGHGAPVGSANQMGCSRQGGPDPNRHAYRGRAGRWHAFLPDRPDRCHRALALADDDVATLSKSG